MKNFLVNLILKYANNIKGVCDNKFTDIELDSNFISNINNNNFFITGIYASCYVITVLASKFNRVVNEKENIIISWHT